jgi:hypothetical protein
MCRFVIPHSSVEGLDVTILQVEVISEFHAGCNLYDRSGMMTSPPSFASVRRINALFSNIEPGTLLTETLPPYSSPSSRMTRREGFALCECRRSSRFVGGKDRLPGLAGGREMGIGAAAEV